MGKSLADLAKKMNRAADRSEKVASELSKKFVYEIAFRLVYDTPVDTSTALSNWQVFLNNPAPDEIGAYSLGQRGTTQAASASAALREAQAELARKQPGQVVYLSNLVDYIKRLNEGSSAQAPPGFIEASVYAARIVTFKGFKTNLFK
ncbi:hypothetical protein [Sphingomonas phage Birtae]|nr:hypothetical protein [Sphingomonas phage Birtae]